MVQVKISREQKQTHRHRSDCGCQGGGRGMDWSLGLVGANYYI